MAWLAAYTTPTWGAQDSLAINFAHQKRIGSEDYAPLLTRRQSASSSLIIVRCASALSSHTDFDNLLLRVSALLLVLNRPCMVGRQLMVAEVIVDTLRNDGGLAHEPKQPSHRGEAKSASKAQDNLASCCRNAWPRRVVSQEPQAHGRSPECNRT